jgi:hypothetical protein
MMLFSFKTMLNKIILSIFVLLRVTSLFSQEKWNTLPKLSLKNTEVTDMITDNNNVVVYGDGLTTNGSKQGLVIAILDSNGVVLKEKTILDSMGDKLAIDRSWGKIIKSSKGGYLATAGTVKRKNTILIKLDESLNIEYLKEYKDSTLINDFWHTPLEVKNGYFLYGVQQLLNDKIVGFIKYVDYKGNVFWEKRFAYSQYENILIDLKAVTDSTFVFVTGEVISLVTSTQQPSSRSSIYNIDLKGNIGTYWQSEPAPKVGYFFNVIPQSNGDFITYGLARKEIFFNTELIQPTLTRFDSKFNILWSYNFGNITSSGALHLQKFCKTIDGNYVGVGQHVEKVGSELKKGYGWVYKFSEDGNMIWERKFPTPLLPNAYPNGGLLYGVGTLTSGSIMAGGTAEDGKNKYCWLVKIRNNGCMDTLFCQTTALINTEGNNIDVKIFPNPADRYITIEAPFDIEKIALYDALGQELFEETVKSKSYILDFPNNIENGIYLIKIQTIDNQNITKRVIINQNN